MGIKGLPKLIQECTGDAAIKFYKFSKFEGMSVSVDASLLFNKIIIGVRSGGKDLRNSKGQLVSHLHGLFYKILTFLQNKMTPIFVFDGKSPKIKSKSLEKRKIRKMQAEKRLEEISDSEDEEYIKNYKQTVKLTKEDIKEAQILLDLMGIPYINAPGEADVVCSWLAARHDANGERYVQGVCSDDSDMLAFGAPYLFKDMLRFMNKNKPVKVISLNKTLVKMNLTMDQFVDLCVLLGTDYCKNVHGIGPKGAYKLIQKYGTLEAVLQYVNNKRGLDKPEAKKNPTVAEELANQECMIDARDYYHNALSDLDKSDDFFITEDNIKLRKFQSEELIDFLCVKHGFDILRIQNGIKRLDQYYREMGITRENTKHVHTIIQPRSENFVFLSLDDIEVMSSDEEDIPTKKTKSTSELIKSSKKKIYDDHDDRDHEDDENYEDHEEIITTSDKSNSTVSETSDLTESTDSTSTNSSDAESECKKINTKKTGKKKYRAKKNRSSKLSV